MRGEIPCMDISLGHSVVILFLQIEYLNIFAEREINKTSTESTELEFETITL